MRTFTISSVNPRAHAEVCFGTRGDASDTHACALSANKTSTFELCTQNISQIARWLRWQRWLNVVAGGALVVLVLPHDWLFISLTSRAQRDIFFINSQHTHSTRATLTRPGATAHQLCHSWPAAAAAAATVATGIYTVCVRVGLDGAVLTALLRNITTLFARSMHTHTHIRTHLSTSADVLAGMQYRRICATEHGVDIS